jgi:hypothetical protein
MRSFLGCLIGSWPGSRPAKFCFRPLPSGGHGLDKRSEDFIYRIRRLEDLRHVRIEDHDNPAFFGLAGETVWFGLPIIKVILGP